MARRYSRPRRRTPSLKRWSPTNDGAGQNGPLRAIISIPASAGDVSAATVFTGGGQIDDYTLLRTRGQMSGHNAVAGLANAAQLTLGIGVLPAASAAVPAAVPQPVLDAEWDGWLLYHTLMIGEGAGQSGTPVAQVEIDSKAMRKVHEGNVLFAAFQGVNLGGGVGGDFIASFMGRFLLKTS